MDVPVVVAHPCLAHAKPNKVETVIFVAGIDQPKETEELMEILLCPACWERDELGLEEICVSIGIPADDYLALRAHVASKGA